MAKRATSWDVKAAGALSRARARARHLGSLYGPPRDADGCVLVPVVHLDKHGLHAARAATNTTTDTTDTEDRP